jgi:hypothetical protein
MVDVSSVLPSPKLVSVLKKLRAEPFGELNYNDKTGTKRIRSPHLRASHFQITVPNITLHSPVNGLDTQVSRDCEVAELNINFITGVLCFLKIWDGLKISSMYNFVNLRIWH